MSVKSHHGHAGWRGWKYRLGVFSRAVAAIGGGYGLAALTTAWLSITLPMPRADAVTTASLLSFLIFALAVIWVFAVRTAWHAWAGLIVPALVIGGLFLLSKGA